jgi:hypothetical protein
MGIEEVAAFFSSKPKMIYRDKEVTELRRPEVTLILECNDPSPLSIPISHGLDSKAAIPTGRDRTRNKA